MSKGKDNLGEAPAKILSYLEAQNRPYSAVDILNNMHKEFGKTLVTKSLDNLVEKGSVKEKSYGKQKVYVYSQENVPTADKQEMVMMDEKIEVMSKATETLQTEVNSLTQKHKKLQSNMTLCEAKANLQKITVECQDMSEKLNKLRNGAVLITKVVKNEVYSAQDLKVKAWKKRKRMAMDIVDAILEGYPKPKKTLFEDIGIETDEDCKVALPK